MTLDFSSNQPALFNLNQVATADTVDFFQGTSNFATIGQQPKTTKVRDASSYFSQKQQTLGVSSAEDVSKPIFRRRRDYSQGNTTMVSNNTRKPRASSKTTKSSRAPGQARNRTQPSR